MSSVLSQIQPAADVSFSEVCCFSIHVKTKRVVFCSIHILFLHMSEVSNKLVPCGHKSAISKLDRMCAIWFFCCTETSGSI